MLEKLTIQEFNENKDKFNELGGTIKIIPSDKDEEIQKVAEDNMPRDLKPTHYLVINTRPMALGVCDVSILYYRKKEDS